MNAAPQNADTLALVRERVKAGLLSCPAFRELDKERRDEIANNTVRSLAYIFGGPDGTSRPAAVTLAGAPREVKRQWDPAGDTAGDRFSQAGAVAAREGTESFTDLVQRVDFPAFVAGLIDGVFNAIVNSSIKQMEAYAELVKNVTKSVDQFMKDNVSENQARDYLADRYPEHLEVDTQGEQPSLKPREGHNEDSLPDFFSDLGLASPVTSLDDDTVEQQLVPAARKRMAMDRQQLLATMVLMGVNRLVVTDGNIKASVLFELNTRDEVKRKFNQASTYDTTTTSTRKPGFWSWFRPSYDESATTSKFQVTTTRAEDSTAKVDMHAKLTGAVEVRFRSDYFPMERMVDVLSIGQIREKAPAAAAPATAPAAPAAPTAPPPAAPPLPAPAVGAR